MSEQYTHPRRGALWCLAVVLALTTGCMLSPYDGKRVANTSSTISFSGYDTAPSTTVRLHAWNFSLGQWVQVGTATSSATVSVTYPDGSELYSWSYSRVLSSSYWAAGARGYYARVKATRDSYNLYSVREDWGTCMGENDTLSDFAANCSTHRTPEAYIYTEDYQHGPLNCTAVPAVSKTRYSLNEIPSCARKAIADLQLQYIDRDIILGHYDINHSVATSFFGDHRKYLGNMEKFLMVYGDKWLPSGHIPAWASNTAIPAEFQVIKQPPAGQNCMSTNSGCTGWYYSPFTNTNPQISKPSNLQPGNVCQYATLEDLFSATNGWHGNVHVTVGGTMKTFDSPAAPLFWTWHTTVDQVWRDWEACP